MAAAAPAAAADQPKAKVINETHVFALIFSGQLHFWAWQHLPHASPADEALSRMHAAAFCELYVEVALHIMPAQDGWSTEKAEFMLRQLQAGK